MESSWEDPEQWKAHPASDLGGQTPGTGTWKSRTGEPKSSTCVLDDCSSLETHGIRGVPTKHRLQKPGRREQNCCATLPWTLHPIKGDPTHYLFWPPSVWLPCWDTVLSFQFTLNSGEQMPPGRSVFQLDLYQPDSVTTTQSSQQQQQIHPL